MHIISPFVNQFLIIDKNTFLINYKIILGFNSCSTDHILHYYYIFFYDFHNQKYLLRIYALCANRNHYFLNTYN